MTSWGSGKNGASGAPGPERSRPPTWMGVGWGVGGEVGEGKGVPGTRMSPVLPKTGEGGCCLLHPGRRGHLPTRLWKVLCSCNN